MVQSDCSSNLQVSIEQVLHVPGPARRAVFLDRDGVINQNCSGYVRRWDDFRFLEGSLAALRKLSQSDFSVIIVTNQSVIGRGLVSAGVIAEINARMITEITSSGGRVDAVYCCPHRPEDHCDCRKPEPGLFIQAARDCGIDLAASYCVGDKLSDLVAAERAGCQGILVLTGEGRQQPRQKAEAYTIVSDLSEAVDVIQRRECSGEHTGVNLPTPC